MVHGGIIAAIMDGAMGHCMFARQLTTVTVEIAVQFRHAVRTGQEATVRAWVVQTAHPLYMLEAEIVQGGQVKAKAKGKYYDQPELKGAE